MYFVILEIKDESLSDVISTLSAGVTVSMITSKKLYITMSDDYPHKKILQKNTVVPNTTYCSYLYETNLLSTNLEKIKKNIRLNGTFYNVSSFYSSYKNEILNRLYFDDYVPSETDLTLLESALYIYVDDRFHYYLDKYKILCETIPLDQLFVIIDCKKSDILEYANTFFSSFSGLSIIQSDTTDSQKLYMMIHSKKGGFYIDNSLSYWGVFFNTLSTSINLRNFPNLNYWNDFYKNNNLFTLEPSSFCIFVLDYLKDYPEHKTIIDLGCGNGRDLLQFYDKGYSTTGIDLSSEICTFLKNNTSLSIINDSFVTYDYPEFDIYYSRFTLHAIDYSLIEEFIRNISCKMNENSLLFIETRSIKGTKYEGKDYVETNFISGIGELHKRTLLTKKHLVNLLNRYNLFTEYEVEQNELSPYRGEDPYLIRLVVRKVHVERLLKNMITPSLLERQYLLKEGFEYIISKLEKHNINYVIFFGNLIGLVRHDNLFVPWDDDIDILVDKNDVDLIKDVFENDYTITDVGDHLILYSSYTNLSYDFFHNCMGVNDNIDLSQYTYINGYRVPLDYETAFYKFYSGISASEIMNSCVIYNHHHHDRWTSKHMIKVKKNIEDVLLMLDELPYMGTDEFRIIYKLVQKFTKKR